MIPPKKTPAWRRYLRFWGSNVPQDVDDELAFHLDMRAKEYVARGMTEADARRLAAERFGDPARPRHECVDIDETYLRRQRRAHAFAGFRNDLVFAARLLRRQRLPSVVAVLCLALGIGATTTMFSIGKTLLLNPMPYANASRVVMIETHHITLKTGTTVSSYLDYMDWRTRAHSFEEMGAFGGTGFTVGLSTPIRAGGGVISANFFHMLGVKPEAGRLFTEDDDTPGAAMVVLVSHRFAEDYLGGAKTVVGKSFDVGGTKRTVVGVIPDSGTFPSGAQIWAPFEGSFNKTHRADRNLDVYASLEPGMTIDAASRELSAIQSQMAAEHPQADSYVSTRVEPLRERYVRSSRTGLAALGVATVLVLLIACTNVAALQIARATARAREIAVRTAIGASRTRIVRQLLTEAVMLAVAGGAIGVAMAFGGVKYVAKAIAGNAPRWMAFHIDGQALAFTFAVSMVAGIAFGILPALRLARTDPSDVLRGGRSAVGVARGALQRVFVVAEIALSVILVVGAMLAIESALRLQAVPLGLDPDAVISFRVALQGSRYDAKEERARVMDQFAKIIAAIPGVSGAGATTYMPINGCCSQFPMQIRGHEVSPKERLLVTGNMITPTFFDALHIPLVAGRAFTEADDAAAPKVVIINETFAKRFWPDGDALGHEIDTGTGMARIVGIVGDIKQGHMADAPEPQFYRPHLQDPWAAMTFVVRAKGIAPNRLMPEVRRAFRQLDASTPIYSVATLDRVIAGTVDPARLFGVLFAVFAGVALALATAGVYATMSFFVSQRTRELGLRVALGAEPVRVVGLMLRQGMAMAAIGGAVGIGAGVFGAKALAHSLYGVTANEPIIYLAGALVLAFAAVAATYGPARRASEVDPMVALRAE